MYPVFGELFVGSYPADFRNLSGHCGAALRAFVGFLLAYVTC